MKKNNYLIISLLSISLIGLEIVWTRIFSAEFFYTYSFLILSLAILGLGLGALAVHLFVKLNNEKTFNLSLSLTGLMTLIAPPLTFVINMDFSQLFSDWFIVLKILFTIVLLSSTYFFGGIALTIIFKNNYKNISKLYMADLIGAGFGVLIAVVIMNIFGTPVTTFLCALPVLIAAIIAHKRSGKLFPAILILGMIVLSIFSNEILEAERKEPPAPIIYKHWDAMAKIKVYDYGTEYRRINLDNAANTGCNGFDGDWENRPDSVKFGFNIVKYVLSQFDSCSFLSLGAGGGQDVFQALEFGATDIHAVEVNPHLNYLLLEGELKDFSGQIYLDPRVKVVTEDARTYVRRYKKKFDVIYSFSSNSFAALASGAFALAENYLFTTEAFQDYWQALSDDGFLIMEHQAFMQRLVSEVMDALEHEGIEDVKSHFAVFKLPKMRRDMLLLSKRPLTKEMLTQAIGEQVPEDFTYAYLQYPPEDSVKNNPIDRIVQKGWQNVADSARINISPCTDDRPFIAQMGLWKNLDFTRMKKLRGYEDWFGLPLTQFIIVIILIVVLILIIPINLIPYLKKGDKLKAVPWLYFFSIGMAFMMVEIILIQKYTLFIGPSIYSIITILLTLLLCSGIGSRFAEKVNNNIVFLGIIVLLLLDIFVFRSLIYSLGGLTMFSRIFVTALLIAPLGFLMGMPFPKGTLKVGPLVDWGFAVNGAASVLGSTLIVLVGITYGLSIALLIGTFCYVCAYILISIKKAW